MAFEMTADVHARMHEFFGKRIGKHLLRSEQRESFATYARRELSPTGSARALSRSPLVPQATHSVQADARSTAALHRSKPME